MDDWGVLTSNYHRRNLRDLRHGSDRRNPRDTFTDVR
jgi:hypothetical protein